MAMEITQVLQGSQPVVHADVLGSDSSNQMREAAALREQARQQHLELTREQVRQYTEELRRVSQAFNKRLSFNYNEELGQMIVKVIDRDTDKVIKELPPSELQRVHLRIREAIGLLLDESA